MVEVRYPKNKDELKTGTYTSSLIMMFRDSAESKHKFMSNFYPCNVTLPKEEIELASGEIVRLPAIDFKSTEQAYMAWKTIDYKTRKKIAEMTPGDAKKFSHQDDFPIRPDYSNEGRLEAMRIVVEQKFSDRNPELRQRLLDTKNAALAEGNNWGDTFFGLDLTTGEGENHLGKILMYVRDNLRKEEGLEPVSEKASLSVEKRKNTFKNTFRF
jgi:ribA/ribD-fused uncharacterized protein